MYRSNSGKASLYIVQIQQWRGCVPFKMAHILEGYKVTHPLYAQEQMIPQGGMDGCTDVLPALQIGAAYGFLTIASMTDRSTSYDEQTDNQYSGESNKRRCRFFADSFGTAVYGATLTA